MFLSMVKNLRKNKIQLVRQTSAMVFQSFNLYPHKTVLENLTLAPIKLQKLSKEEAIKKARKYLAIVGLSEKENAYPATLSGGQQQRVAIARALATEKRLSFLMNQHQRWIRKQFRKCWMS